MKRIVCLVLTLALLLCSTACFAATFDYSLESLQSIVESYTSNPVFTYTTSSGVDRIVINFSKSDDMDVWAEVFFTGTSGRIIKYITFTTDNYAVPASSYNSALMTCNKFNVEYRYPKAFVLEDNTFAADGDLFGTADLTVDMVKEYIDNMIYGTSSFVDFLNTEGWSQFAEYAK